MMSLFYHFDESEEILKPNSIEVWIVNMEIGYLSAIFLGHLLADWGKPWIGWGKDVKPKKPKSQNAAFHCGYLFWRASHWKRKKNANHKRKLWMASMSHLLAASNSLLWGLQARSLSYAAWAQKEPFQLLGDWEPKVTLFKKTEVSLENRTCFTSKRRSVVNWYDSSTVSIWLIYLSWWASSAEQYWKFRATADPHHVLPVASLCFWIHPPRTLQHEDWNGYLPARKRTQGWQGIWSVCLWEHQETPSTKNTSVHTCKHTWAHMFFFNKGGSHSKKNRIYAHLDLQVCSPCSSLMRLEDAMIWYYMTIYDYIYMLLYDTILSRILNLESYSPWPCCEFASAKQSAASPWGHFSPTSGDVLTVAGFAWEIERTILLLVALRNPMENPPSFLDVCSSETSLKEFVLHFYHQKIHGAIITQASGTEKRRRSRTPS